MKFEKNTVKEKSRITRSVAMLMATMMLFTSCIQANTSGQTKTESSEETEETFSSAVEETSSSDAEETSSFDAEETSSPVSEEQKALTTLCVETGYYYDYYWSETSERTIASVKYPYIHLSESDREKYPKLEQAITALTQERKENALRLYEEAVQAAEEATAEYSDYQPFFEVQETVTVRRADSQVFSLLLEGSANTGEPFEYQYSLGVVFDTETGERLELTDVATHEGLLIDCVEEQLYDCWDTAYLYEDLNLQKFFSNNLDSVSWVLDYYGLSVYFQPGDIAPYASGILNITIPFSLHPDLIKDEYREVPISYGIEFTTDKPFFFDVDGDGKTDSITVSPAKGEYVNQSITLNGKTFEEDTGFYVIEPVLMHTADEKNYLYLSIYLDDFWMFEVFDLSSGTVRKIDTVYSERHSIIDYNRDYYARQVLTDASNFMLDTYTLMLGTACGYDSYHVGTDGLPVQKHNWYVISFETELTLLKNLTASVVDEDGKTTEDTTELKAGDKVLYYRTDGETWADLRLSDGSIVRVYPQNDDGEWTLNGIYLEEVFEGIVFGR